MKWIALFLTLFSFTTFAQELEPIINYLRSTPAYMNGNVSFTAGSTLYDESWTTVKILPNKSIGFIFKEDYLEVRPEQGIFVKSGPFRVKIKSVKWTPKGGVVTQSELPADFTGLSRRKVSSEVAEVLSELFGEKLRKANVLLKRVRSQRQIGETMKITKAIVAIFTKSEGMSNIHIPNYRGEIGLNFHPPKPRALNLYGIRIGIKEYDTFRAGINFTGNMEEIYPNSIKFSSIKGIDANTGREWKAMARLVLKNLEINTRGTQIDMHLGATEVVEGILSIAELIARQKNPGASCHQCRDFTSFPSVRLMIEKKMREAILTQVQEQWPLIRQMNVSPRIYAAFRKSESCQLSGLSCVQRCHRTINNFEDRKSCASECGQTTRQCAR